MSPACFRAFRDCRAAPSRTGRLPPPVKGLIKLTLNLSTTHLGNYILRRQIANALALGGSVAEIVEFFRIISILGGHSVTLGVPIMVEE